MIRMGSLRRATALVIAAWVATAPLAMAQAPGGQAPAAPAQAAPAPVPAAPAPAPQNQKKTTPAPEGLGSIRGLLFKEDETTRLAGATVTAINVRTGRRYVSNFTGDNGAYEVTSLPAGTYDLAIDVAGHVYVTDSLVDLAEEQRLYMSFAILAPVAGAAGEGPIFKGGAKMTFTDPNAVPQTQAAAEKKSFWKRPGGIAIISVLVAGTAAAAVSAQQSD